MGAIGSAKLIDDFTRSPIKTDEVKEEKTPIPPVDDGERPPKVKPAAPIPKVDDSKPLAANNGDEDNRQPLPLTPAREKSKLVKTNHRRNRLNRNQFSLLTMRSSI